MLKSQRTWKELKQYEKKQQDAARAEERFYLTVFALFAVLFVVALVRGF
jgi:hypothetical protein